MNSSSPATWPGSTDAIPFTAIAAVSALDAIQFSIGLVGIFGNFVVCFAFLHRRTQRNQTNLLITNQAFIDLFSSVLLVMYTGYDRLGRPEANFVPVRVLACFAWREQTLLFASFSISSFNLTVISLERYIATVYPHSYVRLFTRNKVRFIIVADWLAAPLMQYVYTYTTKEFSDNECYVTYASSLVGVLLFLWEYFVPVCIMSFSFASILRKFRQMNKVLAVTNGNENVVEELPTIELNIRSTQATVSTGITTTRSNYHLSHLHDTEEPTTSRDVEMRERPTPSRHLHARRNVRTGVRSSKNVTKVLLTVYLVYFICWSPNQWAFLQVNLGGTLNYQGYFYKISLIMAILNTCVNPFIYAFRHKTYKERVREMVRSLRAQITCIN